MVGYMDLLKYSRGSSDRGTLSAGLIIAFGFAYFAESLVLLELSVRSLQELPLAGLNLKKKLSIKWNRLPMEFLFRSSLLVLD